MIDCRSLSGVIRSARPANIPTLLTNATVAWVCVHGAVWPSAGLFAGVFFMGLAFYLYGMWGNDSADARWDAKRYPGRPVPSGAVSAFALRMLGLLSAVAGLTLNALLGGGLIDAAALVVVIALYNGLHKAWGGAFILMGACRALWVFSAGVVFGAPFGVGFEQTGPLLAYAVALGVFTCVISIVARRESVKPALLRAVQWLLSGMCLFDAVWLAILGAYECSIVAVFMWMIIRGLQMRGVRST